MAVLVADVGGTNTRIALTGPTGAVHNLARFANDGFATFGAVLTRYLADCAVPDLTGCCVAIAGPVTSEHARLTNRDWDFDVSDIAACIPGVSASSVRLVNDLVALGHALPALADDQLSVIKMSAHQTALNDQSLVAGLGTGFNICVVKGGSSAPVVIEAELGHASLPSSVAQGLHAGIGAKAAEFPTVEKLFSGRGLSRLYCILSDGEYRDGTDILAAYDNSSDERVNLTVDLTAQLLGVFARELVFQYLPFGGIHFAGGAARGILGSSARERFLEAFDAPGHFADLMGRVPVRIITDDAAALTGAARILQGISER